MSSPQITLYTTTTPNGTKISIALEELGLPYEVKVVEISKGVQKESWFKAVNPIGKIPALTDRTGGKELHLFESGAILEYLVDTYDITHKISYPRGTAEYWKVQSWLFWNCTNFSATAVNLFFAIKNAPHFTTDAVEKYAGDLKKEMKALDEQIERNGTGFLVGDKLTIADVTTLPWVGWIERVTNFTLEEYPAVKKWYAELSKREGVQKGLAVPKLD